MTIEIDTLDGTSEEYTKICVALGCSVLKKGCN